jgi:hypothetical protein
MEQNTRLTINTKVASDLDKGLDFILSHLSSPIFPRMIMTKRLGYQNRVHSIEEMIKEFELSNWQDCRINAYPIYPEIDEVDSIFNYNSNIKAATFVMIDFDIGIKSKEELDKKLQATLKRIHKQLKVKPTVIWTGNGYHIYLPIKAFVLENEKIFADFTTNSDSNLNLTSKFMRYAEQLLAKNNHDTHHNPTTSSCLLRIPGTFNSKNGEQVMIVQEWDRNKPAIQYMLRGFWQHLMQQELDRIVQLRAEAKLVSNQKQNEFINTNWIERLLQTPIADHRKYCIWQILAPYPVNVKELSNDKSYDIIISWLEECSKLQRLAFYYKPRVGDDVRRARRLGYYPISLSNLLKGKPELYEIIMASAENR